MAHSINLQQKLALFNEYWSPKIIAELNDYQIKLAKLKEDFVWHSHEDTDEVFFVLSGVLTIDLPDDSVTIRPNELFVVPKGTKHRPHCTDECHVLIIEPRGVVNTGNEEHNLTAQNDIWI